ncbi:hypothetical protein [Paractinoplanes atraurantiacus]|uniref:Uncharacterized protein n=1 Tax=Paractinoplanes atraurantiacus TaxID=1036182 RepID=A0A285FER1_9ACTN|nr:hypothetical protein [Actinoplanes atraurantiacus]SNY09795.1 hypothetical protein SAMN05421748_101901 [Actinoplanes atraurantiacus]
MTTTQRTWFVYFVAIQYGHNGGLGFSNMEFRISVKVTDLAGVQLIEQNLRSNGYPNALVMGYNLLRTETEPVATPGRTR